MASLPAVLRRALPIPATLAAAAVLLHGVDLRQTGSVLAGADWTWLGVGLLLTAGSAGVGAVAWGGLLRATGAPMGWRDVFTWSARSLLAAQVLPGGTGGDAVRVVAARRVTCASTAFAAIAGTRVCSAFGIAVWGLAGAILLHDALGTPAVASAAAMVLAMLVAGALALNADRVVRPLAGHRHPTVRHVGRWVSGMAASLAGFRSKPAVVLQLGLLGLAGWGLTLGGSVALGRAVGVDVGWQVFAVALPLSLAATMVPLSANGMGVREGILVGLLVRAGAAGGQAAALSLLVDLQMLPIALLGAVLWLVGPDRRVSSATGSAEAAEPAALSPVAVPAA